MCKLEIILGKFINQNVQLIDMVGCFFFQKYFGFFFCVFIWFREKIKKYILLFLFLYLFEKKNLILEQTNYIHFIEIVWILFTSRCRRATVIASVLEILCFVIFFFRVEQDNIVQCNNMCCVPYAIGNARAYLCLFGVNLIFGYMWSRDGLIIAKFAPVFNAE